MRTMERLFFVLLLAPASALLPATSPPAFGDDGGRLTLEQAIDTALHRTARARTARGAVEVAEQNYRARRINFYVPSISIIGSLPAYANEQSYRFFGASPVKRLYETRNFGLSSFIQFHQNLITGGDFTMNANLTADRDRYPDTGTGAGGGFIDERTRRGFFEFRLSQPFLKPSTPRNELAGRAEDLTLARLAERDAETALTGEVIDAYIGCLRNQLAETLARDRIDMAGRKAGVDSVKWRDGVISQEDYLATASAYLDAELARRDVEATGVEWRETLALLLDRDPASLVVDSLLLPGAAALSEDESRALATRWHETTAVDRARTVSQQRERDADFAARSHGVSADLQAGYSAGRGNVRVTDLPRDDIRTNSWNVAVNFTCPIWDGGASSAAVKAARFEAERSKLDLERAEKTERAEVARLANQVAVSSRRLEILARQVDLAAERLSIAGERRDDGRITEIAYLEAKVALGEAQARQMDELKSYLANRNQLEGRFP